MATKRPRGILKVTFFRLCARAPLRTSHLPFPLRRSLGTGILFSP